jgi:hypothetical protein
MSFRPALLATLAAAALAAGCASTGDLEQLQAAVDKANAAAQRRL